MADDGASPNELLLAAAKQNSEELLQEVISHPKGSFNFNHTDSIGNTALHYAAQYGSLDILQMLLEQEDVDLDIKNRLEGATPLHKAVEYTNDIDVQIEMVESLIDAGADPRKINKQGQKPIDLVSADNSELKDILRNATAGFTVDNRDLAQDDDDDDDDDEPSDDD